MHRYLTTPFPSRMGRWKSELAFLSKNCELRWKTGSGARAICQKAQNCWLPKLLSQSRPEIAKLSYPLLLSLLFGLSLARVDGLFPDIGWNALRRDDISFLHVARLLRRLITIAGRFRPRLCPVLVGLVGHRAGGLNGSGNHRSCLP